MREAIEVLRGERERPLRRPVRRARPGTWPRSPGWPTTPTQGIEQAREALANGAGLERFRRFVEAQGGDAGIVDDLDRLPQAPVSHDVRADAAGHLAAVDAEAIGRAAASVGAGRRRKEDEIDLAVGIDFLVAIGDEAGGDTVVARVLANDQAAAEEAGRQVLAALSWSDEPVAPPDLIHAVV